MLLHYFYALHIFPLGAAICDVGARPPYIWLVVAWKASNVKAHRNQRTDHQPLWRPLSRWKLGVTNGCTCFRASRPLWVTPKSEYNAYSLGDQYHAAWQFVDPSFSERRIVKDRYVRRCAKLSNSIYQLFIDELKTIVTKTVKEWQHDRDLIAIKIGTGVFGLVYLVFLVFSTRTVI